MSFPTVPDAEKPSVRWGSEVLRTTRKSFFSLLPLLFASAALFTAGLAQARPNRRAAPGASQPRHLLMEKKGSFQTRPALVMRLVSDCGDVVIHTHDAPRVDYRVRLESSNPDDSAGNSASSFEISASNTASGIILRGQRLRPDFGKTGGVWVTFDVTLPRDYSVDIFTGGGSIQAPDLHGRVLVNTRGGNIFIGNVQGAARLQTAGGHISVKDVAGDLVAETGGGHITTGNVAGSATLRTGGGHIRSASIAREARLETAGGNISLGNSGGQLVADTGGGQIDIGQASGAIRATTAGGGIRILGSHGPTQLVSQSGSIYLSRVISAVHAQTASGGITAWFDGVQPTPSELQSADGDIIVYLPSNIAITVEAAGPRHIYVDPALSAKISSQITGQVPRVIQEQASLNGGGQVLRLKTIDGDIRLLPSDQAREAILYRQQMEEIKKQVQQQIQQQIKELQQIRGTGGTP